MVNGLDLEGKYGMMVQIIQVTGQTTWQTVTED